MRHFIRGIEIVVLSVAEKCSLARHFELLHNFGIASAHLATQLHAPSLERVRCESARLDSVHYRAHQSLLQQFYEPLELGTGLRQHPFPPPVLNTHVAKQRSGLTRAPASYV